MRSALVLLLVAALASLSSSSRADWQVRRAPFDPRLVARYREILRRDPDDAPALKALVRLYRAHRSLDGLEAALAASLEREPAAVERLLLGHLRRMRGDLDGAERHYARAVAERPTDPRALAALGKLELQRRNLDRARPLLERALQATTQLGPRRELLRLLGEAALAVERGLGAREALAEARPFYQELLRERPRDLALRKEWAEALAARGAPAEAAVEYERVAQALSRSPAERAAALVRTGALHEAAGDPTAALAALEHAFRLTPAQHHLRPEAADRIIAIHRRRDQLADLLARWEQAWSRRGAFEWETIGRLREELGDAPGAVAAYGRALAIAPARIEVRALRIALLERQGRDDEALTERRRLVASAPGEVRFRLELAERLWRTRPGDPEALRLVEQAGRLRDDPSVHGALAELFERWGLPDRALKERERMVRLDPQDPAHLIALGESHFQGGRRKRALEVWGHLLDRGRPEPEEDRLTRLAGVYADHDLVSEALALYRQALRIRPERTTLRRSVAATLERLHREAEAEAAWRRVFEGALAGGEAATQLEARQHLLRRWRSSGMLAREALGLRAQARAATGAPAIAGYGAFAADALVQLGRLDEAARLLGEIATRLDAAALKAEVLVALARVHRTRGRSEEALAALTQAARAAETAGAAPLRAAELYGQLSELAARLYRDEEALRFARRAVELTPSSAAAQVRLAEVADRAGELDRAVQAYARAIELDDRQWKAIAQLARLHLRRVEYKEAATRYRDLVRRASDEALVLEAAHRAIDLDEALESLPELERELALLARTHPGRAVYRDLLFEAYQRHAPPLVARARLGDPQARLELERLGAHGLAPLLDLLKEGPPAQQAFAAALLGELGNSGAAGLLFKVALGSGSPPIALGSGETTPAASAAPIALRAQAALSAAQLAGPKDLPLLLRLAALPESHLRAAAIYGLGQLTGAKATRALIRALGDDATDVQALACLGLGRASRRGAVDPLFAALNDPDRPGSARAACAIGLGLIAPRDPAEARIRAVLQARALEPSLAVSLAAIWALGVRGAGDAAPLLYRLLWTGPTPVRDAALAALAGPARPHLEAPPRGEDSVDVPAWLRALTAPRAASPPLAWAPHLETIAEAVLASLEGPRAIALRTLWDLDARHDGLALGPLTAKQSDPPDRATIDRLALHLRPRLEALLGGTDRGLRDGALRVLAKLPGGRARVAAALSTGPIELRLAALEALAMAPGVRPAEEVAALELSAVGTDWRERLLAIRAAAGRPGRVAVDGVLRRGAADRDALVRAAGRAAGPQKGTSH